MSTIMTAMASLLLAFLLRLLISTLDLGLVLGHDLEWNVGKDGPSKHGPGLPAHSPHP